MVSEPRDVPDALRLVESFMNSMDVESGEDDLQDLATFKRMYSSWRPT